MNAIRTFIKIDNVRSLAQVRGYQKQRQKLQDELAAWITRTGDSFTMPDVGWN